MSTNPFQPESPPRGLRRWMPGLATLRDYQRGWLARDLAAGLMLSTVLVPVGMGYAEAAGLSAIHGLYATLASLLAYALFGPSRIMVVAPDSALAALTAAAIIPLAAGHADRAPQLAGMLSLLAGALCLAAGLARLGFVTDLLSKPIRLGYLNGIAITVLVGQLPRILGVPAAGGTFADECRGILNALSEGRANPTTCVVGGSCLAILVGFKRWAPRAPGILVVVVAATLATWWFGWAAQAGVQVVGPLPRAMPAFRLPAVSLAELRALAPAAAAVALVAFADMSVLSRAFALRHGYKAAPDQELVALGAANIVAGLFQGFAVTSSSSRTPVAESAGARTQLAGVVGASCVAGMLLLAPGLLRDLPQAALAAVVASACLGLVEVQAARRLLRLRRGEFLLSMVCLLGVTLVGVVQGIFIAVGLALMGVIWRAWRPYHAVLGRVEGLKGYHDVRRHPEGRRVPGLVLFRWDAPLFFANAEIFRARALDAVARAPTRTRWIVVAAEPVTDVDVTAADMLADLDKDLQREGIELGFAEMKGPVKDRLKAYGMFSALGAENFFPTVGQAVDRYLATHPEVAKDWEGQRDVE